jgi:2-methylisocitrate lyase-like PEP mutase family enzyme
MTHDIGAELRALHRPGDPFILANVHDAGLAKLMVGLGAEAVATSSGAHAFTLGLPDMGFVTRDQALAHAQDIVAAVNVPVSGDFENGYGSDPEAVAETVRLAAETGLAGISVEDTDLPSTAAYEFELAVERIRAASAAARALPRDFVLVARADGVLNGAYDMDEALARVRAFDDAGADCLYVPIPPSIQDLARVCAATSKPVNALASGPFAKYRRADFAGIGVARISYGGALARRMQAMAMEVGKAMLEDGDFSGVAASVPASLIEELAFSEG